MKQIRSKLIQGTLLLTIAGFVTRLIGFVYRVYLSHLLGEDLLGIYQLIFPVYGICFTIYAAGIQTAISQLIASHTGQENAPSKQELAIVIRGLFLSVFLALTLTGILWFFSDPIAKYFLLEPLCAPYIKYLSLLFPFCGVTACINGYFYGKKEASIPASTQIIEQLIRVCFVILLCMAFSATGKIGCVIAVFGIVAGEIASCFYNCFHFYKALRKNSPTSFPPRPLKKLSPFCSSSKMGSTLLFLAFTLTITKLILSLLHSVEAVFIPAALKQFGYSSSRALGIYGILSGIAIPFILFPSTITNSFAVMLLPAIAQSHAAKQTKQIRTYVSLSTKYSLYIGYLFTCIFLLFGKQFGVFLFQNQTAGTFITILSWLCPFLYLSTTLTSIINGLGQTQLTFFITVISLMVKIYFLLALVPKQGIQAYLMGTLISQILMTLMEFVYLHNYIILSFQEFFFIPLISLGILGFSSHKLYSLLPKNSPAFTNCLFMGCLILGICIFYVLCLGITGCLPKKKDKKIQKTAF